MRYLGFLVRHGGTAQPAQEAMQDPPVGIQGSTVLSTRRPSGPWGDVFVLATPVTLLTTFRKKRSEARLLT
jgi:hypothetical protein